MLTKEPASEHTHQPALSTDQLAESVKAGDIDTVVVAFTDMQGRLMGKRVDAEYFMETAAHGEAVEGCNYLLALDMEMDPIPGYAMANWESGYGDFDMQPDMGTLRRIPWLEGTALVLCDVAWHDGSPVRPSPRQVLKAQVGRARKLGFEPMVGSELEFYLFKETFAEAHAKGYKDLTPSVPYILDYHVLATSYDEPFLRAVRKGMKGAGIPVEAQARIFDRFYRVDKARSRAGTTESGGGAGLGLAIARGIAEAHRGHLELQRSDETGSVFTIWLPK